MQDPNLTAKFIEFKTSVKAPWDKNAREQKVRVYDSGHIMLWNASWPCFMSVPLKKDAARRLRQKADDIRGAA